MCLGIPAQIVECGEYYARCRSRNGELFIDLSLVGRQPVGSWLMTFLDAAREVISAERAAAINAALLALESVQSGATDFTAFFADLDREPQLPDFLRTEQS